MMAGSAALLFLCLVFFRVDLCVILFVFAERIVYKL